MGNEKLNKSCQFYTEVLGKYADLIKHNIYAYGDDYQIFKDENGSPIAYNGKIFICPLCCDRIYAPNYLRRTASDYLTLDHVPPKSVGKFIKVPICNNCNSYFGATADKELLDFLNFLSFVNMEEDSKIDGFVQLNESRKKLKFEMGMKHSDKAIFLKTHSHNFKPNSELLQHIIKNKGVEVVISSGDRKKAYLSLIRSAYLMMFNYFGYDFIFNENASKIRDVIFERMEHPVKSYGIVYTNNPNQSNGISIMNTPDDVVGFLCTMSIKIGNSIQPEFISVIIPGPDTKGWEKFIDLQKYDKGIGMIQGIHLKDKPISRGDLNAYSTMWNRVSTLRTKGA